MSNGPSPHRLYPWLTKHDWFIWRTLSRIPTLSSATTLLWWFWKPREFWAERLYHFDFNGDKLIIGKFCSIASDVKFIMNGGNHRTDWFTNYPFPIFGSGWEAAMPDEWPNKGDTLATTFGLVTKRQSCLVFGLETVQSLLQSQSLHGMLRHTLLLVAILPKNIRLRFRHLSFRNFWWFDGGIGTSITRNLKAICGADINALHGAL